jgi:hypothetical protein
MASYDPAQVRAAQITPRFSVLARTGLDVATLGTWDADLLHEPRVLVPVDVQAYVVPAAGAEPALALPGPLSPGHGTDPAVIDGPPPFTAGTPRPAGVHLSGPCPTPCSADGSGPAAGQRRRVGMGAARPLGRARVPPRGAPQQQAAIRELDLDTLSGAAVTAAGAEAPAAAGPGRIFH